MASQFNLLKDIDPSSENQVYKIKVRLIKSWSLIYSELKYQKPMIELVVMDEMGDHIQYTIRNPLRRLFEGDLSDSKVYTISNFSLSLNDQKYKPTTHSHHVIGLITGKGDTIEFIRKGKSCVYIVVELDDMKDNGSMGVSNTNCNSILYINVDFSEVKDFRKSVIMVEVLPANQLSQLSDGPLYSLEDNLIKQTSFKNICDLKESSEA
ncbi:hypothetical protein Ahy_A03g014480 [Arachis hypogaea]|uniref:Replication protein A 70 kDa DNA-binding subunit B/D first OB fold domain-containing protein n=1 Tax=Arachis hypogaea TaxID=3818 RepID=A0A445DXV0_ARAHY|nr:hypothetical protein Ahy_A03g014480 [Arachis hypogaea]